MQSYTKQRTIGAYTVEKALIQNLEDYLTKDVFRVLNWSSDKLEINFGITLYDSIGQEKYLTTEDHKHNLFRNDIKAITIELESKQLPKEIKIVLRFGKEKSNSDLMISLTDENARDKTASIESGLESVLHQYKNYNLIFYPGDTIEILLWLGGFITGLLAISGDYSKKQSFIYGCFFWLAFFYLYICRYFKGYCMFDTNKQKQLNSLFAWVAAGLGGFLIFTSLLTSVRRQIFGF